MVEHEQISATELQELKQLLGDKIIVLDVRSKEEYDNYHMIGALHFPITSLSLEHVMQKLKLTNQSDAILVTYCNAGGRGGRSFALIKSQLHIDSKIKIKNLKHGLNEWINCGYKVVK